jgi:uncharacterized protein YebE (UPF0316 family)
MMFDQAAIFQWVVLPLLIFSARVIDVSLDTMRILFISRGRRMIAALLGFAQILIWLFAIRQIFLNLSNPACFIAYAAGFATGTWTGVLIEDKLAIGIQIVRIISTRDASQLIMALKGKGYGVTVVSGYGALGDVSIIYTIVRRQRVPKVIKAIMEFNPKAFYTVEDVRSASEQSSLGAGRSFKRTVRVRH